MNVSRRLLFFALAPLLLAVTLPWVLPGSKAVDCDTSGLSQWLPDRHPERNQYQLFVRHFGADDSVLVSWPDCTLDDPHLEQLAARLERETGRDAVREEDRPIEKIITGPRLLERLTSEPLNLARREALRRLTGFVVGPDGQTTCAIIKLTSRGQGSQKRVIQTT